MQHLSSKKYEHLMHVSELFDGQSHQQAEGDRALLASDEVKAHLKNWSLIGSALRGELPAKVDLNFADKVMARLEHETMEPCAFATSDVQSVSAVAGADKSAAAYRNEREFAWVPPCDQYAEQHDEELPALLQKRNASKQRVMSVANEAASAQETVMVQSRAQREHMGSQLRQFFSMKRLAMFTSQVAIAASVAVVAIVGLQTYNAADPVLSEPASTIATNVGPVSGLSLASYQNSDNEVLMNLKQMPEPNLNGKEAYQSDLERKQQEELERINMYVQGYVLDTAANR